MSLISADGLPRFFEYRCDGTLLWRRRDDMPTQWNNRYVGQTAGTRTRQGYVQVAICNRVYKMHRVVWAWHTGEWPIGEIDHINGDPGDNRIENLRLATRAENATNRGLQSNNTSGVTGVSWCRQKKMWRSYIGVSGSFLHIGYFRDKSAAQDAYARASAKYHGAYSRQESASKVPCRP